MHAHRTGLKGFSQCNLTIPDSLGFLQNYISGFLALNLSQTAFRWVSDIDFHMAISIRLRPQPPQVLFGRSLHFLQHGVSFTNAAS